MSLIVMGSLAQVQAQDWSIPEQQLARKIVEITGAGPAALAIENRSSLGRRDSEIIRNGLRNALENAGIRSGQNSPGMTAVTITLSENTNSYVWVAQVAAGQDQSSIVMVAVLKPAGVAVNHESVPLTLRKVPLWQQKLSMLDVLALLDGPSPGRIAVLESDRVAIYRMEGSKGMLEQSLAISHVGAWPRDLRGRLVPGGDHLLDVYLPGVVCRSNNSQALTLSCGSNDDPWPVIMNKSAIIARASFVAARNFFSGAVTSTVGKFSSVPFYSAAMVARDAPALWVVSGIDREIHIADRAGDRVVAVNWGSDITALQTSCGSGWQILATSPGTDGSDSIRAYEIPDRDPVPVSPAVDFAGTVSALWTEPRGDAGLAIVRNPITGNYEAFRLAVDCGQ